VPSVPPTVFQGLRTPSKLGFCTGWLAQAGAAGVDELAEFPVLAPVVELTDEEVDAVVELEIIDEVLEEGTDDVLEETVDDMLLLAVDLTPLEVEDCKDGVATMLHADSTTAEGYFRRSAGVEAAASRLRLWDTEGCEAVADKAELHHDCSFDH